MLANKRKRSENWDSTDKILLQQLIEEKINIIEDKRVDTNTSKAKREAWKNILRSFNQCSITQRRVAQIQTQWRNTKMQTKKRVSNYKRERGATGGGPPPTSLNPNDEHLLALIPNEFEVDQNKFDSDANVPHTNENLETEDADVEFILEELEDRATPVLSPEEGDSTTPLTTFNNISQSETGCKKPKKCKYSSDENLKNQYLEVAIQAKQTELDYARNKHEEDMENLRLERSLKKKAYENEENRNEEEHSLKMEVYNADKRNKEEEHQLRLKYLKDEHHLRKEQIMQMRF